MWDLYDIRLHIRSYIYQYIYIQPYVLYTLRV